MVPWGASRGAREPQKLVKVKMVVMVVGEGGKGVCYKIKLLSIIMKYN